MRLVVGTFNGKGGSYGAKGRLFKIKSGSPRVKMTLSRDMSGMRESAKREETAFQGKGNKNRKALELGW